MKMDRLLDKLEVLHAQSPSPPHSDHWFWIVSEGELSSKPGPTVKDIQRSVCSRFPGVSMGDITSERRTSKIVFPRQVAMFLATELTSKSLPTIGRAFKRDHTTVLYSIRKIGRLRKDPRVSQLIADIQKELAA